MEKALREIKLGIILVLFIFFAAFLAEHNIFPFFFLTYAFHPSSTYMHLCISSPKEACTFKNVPHMIRCG